MKSSALKLISKIFYVSMLARYQFDFSYSCLGNMFEKVMKLWVQVHLLSGHTRYSGEVQELLDIKYIHWGL